MAEIRKVYYTEDDDKSLPKENVINYGFEKTCLLTRKYCYNIPNKVAKNNENC
jgi:hypothetical protein